MQKKFNKESNEFMFFKEYYIFIQKYEEPEDNDLFWDDAVKTGEELGRKYKGQFYSDLIMAHLNELQRKLKNGRSNKQ